METLQPLSEEGRNAVSFPLLSKSWMEFGGAGTSRVIPEMDGAAMVTQLVLVRGKELVWSTLHHLPKADRKSATVTPSRLCHRSLGTWQGED